MFFALCQIQAFSRLLCQLQKTGKGQPKVLTVDFLWHVLTFHGGSLPAKWSGHRVGHFFDYPNARALRNHNVFAPEQEIRLPNGGSKPIVHHC